MKKKEVEHEIQLAISQRKYQLTTLILKANILLLTFDRPKVFGTHTWYQGGGGG